MVDDFTGAEDGAAGRGVADGGEERILGFQVLGVLGFRVRGLVGVRRDLEEGRSRF
jgi:hypothetical protein